MILIVKGKPNRAMCCQCRHLYEPSRPELEATAKRKNPAFVCQPCRERISAKLKRGLPVCMESVS